MVKNICAHLEDRQAMPLERSVAVHRRGGSVAKTLLPREVEDASALSCLRESIMLSALCVILKLKLGDK